MEEKTIKQVKEIKCETKEKKGWNCRTVKWEKEYDYLSATCPWCGRENEFDPLTKEKISTCRHFKEIKGENVVFTKEWELLVFRRVSFPTVHSEYRLGERISMTVALDDFKFSDSIGYPRESLSLGERYEWADDEARNEKGEIVPHHCSRCGRNLPAYYRSKHGTGVCECGGIIEPVDIEWYHHM